MAYLWDMFELTVVARAAYNRGQKSWVYFALWTRGGGGVQ